MGGRSSPLHSPRLMSAKTQTFLVLFSEDRKRATLNVLLPYLASGRAKMVLRGVGGRHLAAGTLLLRLAGLGRVGHVARMGETLLHDFVGLGRRDNMETGMGGACSAQG